MNHSISITESPNPSCQVGVQRSMEGKVKLKWKLSEDLAHSTEDESSAILADIHATTATQCPGVKYADMLVKEAPQKEGYSGQSNKSMDPSLSLAFSSTSRNHAKSSPKHDNCRF